MAEDGGPTVSRGPAVDSVQVKGNVVIWSCTVGESVFHKRTFDFTNETQPVIQALFTAFSTAPTASPSPAPPPRSLGSEHLLAPDLSPTHIRRDSNRRALVVILQTLMHIIYPAGGSYVVHLPFDIRRVWSVPLGLLLDRHPESIQQSILSGSDPHLPRLFTLSSPLDDFGMVTSSRPIVDANEEFIFVSSGEDGILLSRNKTENRLTIWHASSDQQVHRKVSLYLEIQTYHHSRFREDDHPSVRPLSNPMMTMNSTSPPFEYPRVRNPWNDRIRGSLMSASQWIERHLQTPIV